MTDIDCLRLIAELRKVVKKNILESLCKKIQRKSQHYENQLIADPPKTDIQKEKIKEKARIYLELFRTRVRESIRISDEEANILYNWKINPSKDGIYYPFLENMKVILYNCFPIEIPSELCPKVKNPIDNMKGLALALTRTKDFWEDLESRDA
ncbi:MAG: hypothetical protein H6791_00645 [Candidatus Nomurabacteria bacterium]|nr:MAG: hypothetical protein H6791_00645 [Candidatus Nomurabacteria bacterium]